VLELEFRRRGGAEQGDQLCGEGVEFAADMGDLGSS
jgi:hypothetical protein